jgi:hypothetical protein
MMMKASAKFTFDTQVLKRAVDSMGEEIEELESRLS